MFSAKENAWEKDLEEEQKTPKFDLHLGHLAIVAVCALFLVSMVYMKNGFRFQSFARKQESYDFEKAKQEALAQAQDSSNKGYGEDTKNLLSQLATGLGQVAGATTLNPAELLDLPKNADVFDPDILEGLPWKTFESMNPADMSWYIQQVQDLEIEYNTESMMLALSGGDKSLLQTTSEDYKNLSAALLSVPLPSPMQDYARLKFLQYFYYAATADVFAGKLVMSGEDADKLFKEIFLVEDRLSSEIKTLQEKFGPELSE